MLKFSCKESKREDMNLSTEFWKLVYICLVLNTSKRVVWKNIQQNELKNPSPRGWQLFSDRRALTNQISHWSSIYRNDPKVIFRRSQSSSSINITVYRKGKYAMSQRSCRSPHDLFGLLMISWESLGRTIN